MATIFYSIAAIYVFLRSWNSNLLTYLAIPVFITGVFKYAERTWVLRSSSSVQLKHSLLTDPDPGPDVALILEKKVQNKLERDPRLAIIIPAEDIKSEKDYVVQGNFLFKRFLYLYAGLILGYYERIDSYSIIHNKSAEDAFKIVAVELGFMYDKLYTKASLVYSWLGVIIRGTSLCFLAATLLAFTFIVDKHVYQKIDIFITYSLLVGAIVLEVYALILLFFSDWTKFWLTVLKKARCNSLPCATNRKRWSAIMGQYNLLSVCLKKPAKCTRVRKILGIHGKLEKFINKTSAEISSGLQRLIFEQLFEKGIKIEGRDFQMSLCKEFLAHRGDYVLAKWNLFDEFSWCTVDVEFDHSLLLWHIATSICYHNDSKKDGRNKRKKDTDSSYEISKCLSDYMLYLLVIRQTMLPKGIGEIRYRDTCAEARRFFEQKGMISSDKEIEEACRKLLNVNVSSLEMLEDIKNDRSQSVLFSGCILAKILENFEFEMGCEKKWEMISQVWVEMLAYAANQCGWREHGQQLRRGGELLTHVCLVMAHLGLSEQYQIQTQFINWAHIPSVDKSGLKLEKHFSDFCGSIGYALTCIGCLFCICPCLCCFPMYCPDCFEKCCDRVMD